VVDRGDSVRAEAKAWIEENWDPQISVREWLERLADSGWASPTWPTEWYGKGLSNAELAGAYEEFRTLGAPGPPAGLSRMLAAPTIIAHGTDEQKRRYVRSILVGEESWCQLFSEPGAGSDLASLQTKAIRDGDEWVITGQKVWTSGAHTADLGMLIARTNPDAPKHKGISYFAFEMDQPGRVEIRPLKQITGAAHFAEVFFDEARVPHEAIIGGENEGWGVALTTLANERVGLGGGAVSGFLFTAPGGTRAKEQLEQSVGEMVERYRKSPSTFIAANAGAARATLSPKRLIEFAKENGRNTDPHIRQRLVGLYTLSELSRMNALRAKAAVAAGQRPGPEVSIGKLMISRITRATRDTATAIAGAASMLDGPESPLDGAVTQQFLGSPAPSIYGGSDEIQKNIVGERVLGLPKEPDVSRDVPFRDLKVGTQR
jgi:alkylation response protein AidB-like acyl-CoA dehydrogenase